MRDADCVEFLQWALPQMDMRWPGFRKVRRQVCRRVAARVAELALADLQVYRAVLAGNAAEWDHLATLCRVTVSRFLRDRELWFALGREVLPAFTAQVPDGGRQLRCWSAGCASGEEPYSLTLVWYQLVQPVAAGWKISVTATDIDDEVLRRARRACYGAGSLRELPAEWRQSCFQRRDGEYCLRRRFLEPVELLGQDLRRHTPVGRFHMILCRNLVLTYFSPRLQQRILGRLRDALLSGGVLVLGSHEYPPENAGFASWPHVKGVYGKQ
jgi:chemotaxis protein methyltransferase CheR